MPKLLKKWPRKLMKMVTKEDNKLLMKREVSVKA